MLFDLDNLESMASDGCARCELLASVCLAEALSHNRLCGGSFIKLNSVTSLHASDLNFVMRTESFSCHRSWSSQS